MNANNLLPHKLKITAPLRRHRRSSRQRYQQHLDDQTKKNVSNEKQLKWKALNEQIDTVKEKKRTLINTINELHTDADLNISQAEGRSSLEEIMSLLAGKVHLFSKDCNRKSLLTLNIFHTLF